jgi:hypothetical protein
LEMTSLILDFSSVPILEKIPIVIPRQADQAAILDRVG